jgi:nitrogen fixation/metabolism regulation signal transduction histidine kinase
LQEGKTFLSRKGTSADHGIGLSSVRKIIESHGGDLDLVPGEESFLVGITVGL